MSIWSSIEGDDPVILESTYAEYVDPQIWLDVAVSAAGDSTRIIIRSSHGESSIALNPDGLAELHRRVVKARIAMSRRTMWREG